MGNTLVPIGTWRQNAHWKHLERGYTTDPVTLALGVCEEAGEIAKAVNMFHNPLYVPSDHAHSDSVEHEIKDILIYLGALANALDLDIEF